MRVTDCDCDAVIVWVAELLGEHTVFCACKLMPPNQPLEVYNDAFTLLSARTEATAMPNPGVGTYGEAKLRGAFQVTLAVDVHARR